MGVSNLTPWQQFLSRKFPGKNAQFSNDQFLQAAEEFFGKIPIPPGSQIISQNAGGAEWIDPEGYRHQARRSLDGTDPNVGQISDDTNRPNILPPAGPVNQLPSDLAQYAHSLMGPVSLAQLDPDTKAALDAITASNKAALDQQFQRQSASAIADLYGNRVNQSSIANSALAQLLQQQGLVSAQALSDSAQRELGVRQYLTQAGGQRNQDLLDLLKNLSGQQTQRDIAGGQLGLGYGDLAERARQANQAYVLGKQRTNIEQGQASDIFPKILGGIGALGSLAGGFGGLIGGIGALSGGRGVGSSSLPVIGGGR